MTMMTKDENNGGICSEQLKEIHMTKICMYIRSTKPKNFYLTKSRFHHRVMGTLIRVLKASLIGWSSEVVSDGSSDENTV